MVAVTILDCACYVARLGDDVTSQRRGIHEPSCDAYRPHPNRWQRCEDDSFRHRVDGMPERITP